MNSSQRHLTIEYLSHRGRLCRPTPVTSLPLAERYSQIERLVDHLWSLASVLNVNLGARPTCIIMGGSTFTSHDLLRTLAALDVELSATYLMSGLAAAQTRAFYETATHQLGKPATQYKVIVDETSEEDNDYFPTLD